MPNRALRVGDWVTFRDGALEELRKVHKWLPTQEEWNIQRELEAQIVDRSTLGLICASVSGWGKTKVLVNCFPHHVRLDDRPRLWAAHDRIETAKLATREKRAARRKAK